VYGSAQNILRRKRILFAVKLSARILAQHVEIRRCKGSAEGFQGSFRDSFFRRSKMNKDKNIFKPLAWLMTLLLAAVVAGCGDGGGSAAGGRGPAPVNLLSISTNNFVILAKDQITDANLSSITGNIGLSPTSGAFIFVSCAEMAGVGKIYDVNGGYAVAGFAACAMPGPGANKVLVDQAVADIGTAYLAASAPATPAGVGAAHLNVGAGTLNGQNFAPGTYTWGSDVNVTGDITLTGGASDVWIFQMSGNLTLASAGSLPSGTHIVLSGGAQPSNIFWQVGGGTGATLGTNSTFNGNILSAKQVIMQSGAVLHGRALSQTQVTLDANTVGP